MGNDNCTAACQGNYEESCGGDISHMLITGSEIGKFIKITTFKEVRGSLFICEDNFNI